MGWSRMKDTVQFFLVSGLFFPPSAGLIENHHCTASRFGLTPGGRIIYSPWSER